MGATVATCDAGASARRLGHKCEPPQRPRAKDEAFRALRAGTVPAPQWSMALPYPYEVETGQLRPPPRAPRAPFDIKTHLLDDIRPAGDDLCMFDIPLPARQDQTGSETAALCREALTQLFQERRPDADERTWESFVQQARALVERRLSADDELLRALLLTVDGL
jgi:hypothetical protein